MPAPQQRDDWRGLFFAVLEAHRIFDGVPYISLEKPKKPDTFVCQVSVSCAGGG